MNEKNGQKIVKVYNPQQYCIIIIVCVCVSVKNVQVRIEFSKSPKGPDGERISVAGIADGACLVKHPLYSFLEKSQKISEIF